MLQRNGIDVKVKTVDLILLKELPISTVCRLRIDYAKAVDEACPRVLFLKLPRGTDHAEIEFYRTAAPGIGCPPLVRCYDAASSNSTAHILLDDLTDTHTQPRDKRAPSEEMSRRAVRALARAHAACWNKRVGTVFDDQWLQSFIENLNRSVMDFQKVVELTTKQTEAYRRMLDAAPQIWGRLTDPTNLTVTHGDAHWWNFLYPNDSLKHDVRIIDWHLWHTDLGARDLAFLIALGGFAEPRPAIEQDLLGAYHDELAIPEYPFAKLCEDYRRSAIRNLNIPVIFLTQGRHRSIVRQTLRRAWEAYERLDCGEMMVT